MVATVEKISVSIPIEDLEWAREKAEQDDKTLSAVLVEALRQQRQFEARRRLLETLGGTDDIPDEIRAEVDAEWREAGLL
jgi:monoamine oxidase